MNFEKEVGKLTFPNTAECRRELLLFSDSNPKISLRLSLRFPPLTQQTHIKKHSIQRKNKNKMFNECIL